MSTEGNLSRTACLLLAFGGPRSLDEVAFFLERLTGKQPSAERVTELRQRYQAIGGASPLPEMTRRQAQAVEAALRQRGKSLRVSCGMRYSHPLIAEALEEIRKEEISRIILIPLSPYRSAFTSDAYYAEAKQIVATWDKGIELIQVTDWHTHPALCVVWAKRIEQGRRRVAEKKESIPVIFTAHSLPQRVAAGSPYVRQLEETITGIISITGPLRWRLAFQSRGREGEEWLGPEPVQCFQELFAEGLRTVLICPIGFISDHLETLYDLDITLKEQADKQGIAVVRIPCLNDAPELIEVLVQLVERALEGQ
jgi:ferrochelatase